MHASTCTDAVATTTRRRDGARSPVVALATLLLLVTASMAIAAPPMGTSQVSAEERPTDPGGPTRVQVDVLVYGSEPEAIIAAVAATEEGAETLLVTPDDRLGGLFVLGELNVLDLKTQPHDYQRGLFERWWRMVGRGESFDVEDAERAFTELLATAGVRVVRSVTDVSPVTDAPGVLSGIDFEAGEGRRFEVRAAHVIDGTADADLAAAAGAGFDVGWRAFGVDIRQADTLVLRVAGVDWQALTQGVRSRGRDYAVAKDDVVWGHFGSVPARYEPSRSGLRLRGLNLGLQDDGTVLVNALLIYGIDPLRPESLAEGRDRAVAEGPSIVTYLAQHVPGFEDAVFAGGAERLYVRESRHLHARCVLSAADVFDNRVTPQDVAAGGYPLDAQSMTPSDTGFVWGNPEMYGGRLCMLVPLGGPSGLWVVGRSAGYDPVAFASARVVPFGMAMAEAAGVAASVAVSRGVSAQTAALDSVLIAAVRERLSERGAYLPAVRPRPPLGPFEHDHYDAFRVMVGRGLAVGGYENDPRLDRAATTLSFTYLLANVATRFHFQAAVAQQLVDVAPEIAPLDAALTPEVAAALMSEAACLLGACPAQAGWEGLHAAGLAWSESPPHGTLAQGQAYELAAALARAAGR